MIELILKALCILIPLMILCINGYSQGGLPVAQVNSSDSSYSIFMAVSPTNTYGNRYNIFQLAKDGFNRQSSFSLKVKNFRLDSLMSGRNDPSPDYFLGNDINGVFKSTAKANVRLDISNTNNLQDSLADKLRKSAFTGAAIIGLLGFTPLSSEADPYWHNDSTNFLKKVDAITLYEPKLGYTPYNSTNPNGYISSYTETDPVYTASPSFGITGTNISNWNTAFGWGNHASVGYLLASAAASTYQPIGSYATTSQLASKYDASNPAGYISSVPAQSFSSLTGKPTTLGGYGITDGQSLIVAPNTINKYWNGYKNFVSLNTDSVVEATNLYYTISRFNTAFSGKTTSSLAEGSNLYYTDTRARNAITLTTTGTTGAATYNSGTLNIPNYNSGLTISSIDTLSAARSFNTSYLGSSTKYIDIRPSASITCNLSLTGGQAGIIFLETSSDNSTWTQMGQIVGTNTGALTIGLSTQQITGGQVSTLLPPTYFWRLRTSNTTGTPTYTMNVGNKIAY